MAYFEGLVVEPGLILDPGYGVPVEELIVPMAVNEYITFGHSEVSELSACIRKMEKCKEKWDAKEENYKKEIEELKKKLEETAKERDECKKQLSERKG